MRRGGTRDAVRRALAPLAGAALLAACVAHPPEPRALDVPVPEGWSAAGSPAALDSAEIDDAPTRVEAWWTTLGSAELAAVVALALEQNRDLRAAAARVEAARARARAAGAELVPSADLVATGLRQRQNFVGFPLPGGADVLSTTSTTWGVSLDVSWELDLWGRLAARERAALAELGATAAEAAAARLSIAGQAAKGWLALVEAREQLALAEETVASWRESVELARARWERGRGDVLDARLLESDLAAAEAVRADRREARERAVRSLEALLGRYPAGALAAEDGLAAPPPVPVGVPSELLRRRPDLVAAELVLAAADERLAAARADRWPSLGLTASGGRRSAELGDLVDADFDVWSLGGRLVAPVFRGGALREAVAEADARAREALARWQQAVLDAFAEVETLLAIEEALVESEERLAAAAAAARDARGLADERYREGRGEVLTVLTAQRRALETQSRLLAVRRAHAESRVDLHLALGGGFDAGGALAAGARRGGVDAGTAGGDPAGGSQEFAGDELGAGGER